MAPDKQKMYKNEIFAHEPSAFVGEKCILFVGISIPQS